MSKLWNALYNWRELWFWPVIAFLQLLLLIGITHWITGRPPQESPDRLVGLGFNILLVVIAISLLSILKESVGRWWTKDELTTSPIAVHIIWTEVIGKVSAFAIIVYALTHG